MKIKTGFVYPLIFLGLVGLLATQPGVSRADVVTGGLSRIGLEGVIISVEEGTITEVGQHKLRIRALGLFPRITLDASSIVSGGEAKGELAFELEITNLAPQRIVLQGETLFQRGKRGVSIQLNLLPGEIKVLQLQTTYPNPASFSFAVMGDNREGDRIFSSILKRLNQAKPLFAVNCGDLVNTGKRGEYRQFIGLIRSFLYPLFFSVGNHDIMWWGSKVYQEYFGPTYYSFDFRQAHFIFLDNALGRIDDHQFRWLEQDLQRNAKPYTFMFMHIPPFDSRPDKYHAMDSQANAQYLMYLAARYGVDRVFCSHIHEYHREERNGVVYIITGGAGSKLRAPEAFYHYLLITVSPEGITEEIIKLD